MFSNYSGMITWATNNRLLSALRQMSLIKIRQREWHPYKATKIEVLSFFLEREVVTCHNLMDRFNTGYTATPGKVDSTTISKRDLGVN